ncbi:MAG TPA: GH1 family beta-glucosidase [Aggregatilineales bacterium]|nr:GH1 family beta-glucosidase [Aggregatilineales bacterium]
MTVSFPAGFQWGTATASYQIEGAVREDGRGESIWDRFSHTPGMTHNGDTGDVACDHYHRYTDDVRLMTDLGINTYRFSIAWPRVIPGGKGKVNEAGLAFYDRLVDELCKAGLVPFATLYHWDLPQALEDVNGWRNRDTAYHFAEYARVVSKRLGDRVKDWMTFNEPICIAHTGHFDGRHAPGHTDKTYGEANQTSHHVYLGHGLAVPILRANAGPDTRVGIVLNMSPVHPASDSDADRAAAERVHSQINRWFADPLFKGVYPADMIALYGSHVPDIQDGDMQIIATPLDFLGVNYYSRRVIADDPTATNITKSRDLRIEGAEHTEMGWEVYPDGLRELLVNVHREYHPKAMYVTENGCAFPDHVENGQVHDPRRVSYLREHFLAAHQAIAIGVPLRGYFVWSLMDNFEWGFGYSKRFGIVYVDYPTQQRIPKDSFAFCQGVFHNNAVPEV